MMEESDAEAAEALRARWLDVTRRALPQAAKGRPDWPISLDHCFARVLLDNICGQVWYEVLARPAYRYMSADELARAVALGADVLCGRADLAERSLRLRGGTASTRLGPSPRRRQAGPSGLRPDRLAGPAARGSHRL